jgi:very-short-patch-repair endonuclease
MTRAQFLLGKGIRVLRFPNHELRENLDGVLETIYRTLTPTRHAARADLPLSGGEKIVTT